MLQKSAWTIGNNYFYNTEKVPSKYSDTEGGSRAAGTLDLSTVFNSNIDDCDYKDRNLNAECLRPSSNPNDWLKLFQSGAKTSIQVNNDFAGCKRNANNPSIGAFEFNEGCEEITDSDDSTDIDIDLQVKFIINYCTTGSDDLKLVGEFCNWKVDQGYTLKNDGNCNWSYTLTKPDSSFKYKFVVNSASPKWESDPNRIFSLVSLNNLVKKSSSGKYENCSYSIKDNLVSLTCDWR